MSETPQTPSGPNGFARNNESLFFLFMGFGQKLCSKKFDAQKIRYICREPPRNPSAVVAFLLYVLFLLSSLIKPGKLEAELAARVKFF